MSEKLIVRKENSVLPFALQFLEAVPEAKLDQISGGYNDKLQVWEYGKKELSTSFPVASFPNVERPPTISTIPTRITPKIVHADAGPDD